VSVCVCVCVCKYRHIMGIGLHGYEGQEVPIYASMSWATKKATSVSQSALKA
jgi:hypothetical protein